MRYFRKFPIAATIIGAAPPMAAAIAPVSSPLRAKRNRPLVQFAGLYDKAVVPIFHRPPYRAEDSLPEH